MIRGARAAKRAPSWQDLRAVYPPTAICGAFRMHGAHILPEPALFRMHGARILPRTGGFPARGRFRDAWSAKPATDCRPGTHRGGILPRQGTRERIAREYCHCQSGQECIRAQSCRRRTLGGRTAREYCHYQSPENAFRAYPAIAGCLGMHSVDILPSADIRECAVSAYLHCRSSGRATFSTRGSGFRPLAALWGSARNTFCAREWAFRLLGA